MSREAAEALTESIQRHLDQADQACTNLLTGGVPPSTVAAMLMRTWTEFAEQANDAEITDAMWRHMVAPRVQAILDGSWVS